jgi:hypothetical protein
VLTPFNHRLWIEPDYRRAIESLEEEVRAQDVGLMFIKALARNLWRDSKEARYATWYEPLDEQGPIDAAVAFALSRPTVTGIATAGDVRLLPMMIEAERRAASTTTEAAAAELASIPEMEPPFVRVPGREIPDWLEDTVTET